MKIKEFTTVSSNDFSIGQAVEFHDELNPKLWENHKLKPEIRKSLLAISKDFVNFIGIGLDVIDITVSGSNAAYSYTEHSDIDLHIISNVSKEKSELSELFDAKKNIYNIEHDIKIKGIDVELYVQPFDQPHHSLGIYSVLNDEWISKPKKEKITINSDDVKSKFKNYRDEIQLVLGSKKLDLVKEMWENIRRMRRSGLAKEGEFGVENLAFKMLRNQGWLSKLKSHMQNLKSKELSIEQRGQK